MIGVLGAVVLLALGVIPWHRLNQSERPPRKPSSLRQRQIDRESHESQPITWRR